MQAFKYKGVDSAGDRIEGEIVANTIEEAERKLSARDVTIIALFPMSLRSRGEETPKDARPARGPGKFKESDVAAILNDLAIMIESGVPFVEALEAVATTSKSSHIRASITKLRTDVLEGSGLADAMRSANGLFPEVVCELVNVAEEGGRLDRALSSAATYVERSAELRRKVANAMLYPAVLTVIALLAMVVLFCFVLPKFGGIFKSMKVDIPATTKFLLDGGEFVRAHPFWVALAVLGLGVAAKLVLARPATKAALSTASLKAPLVGDLARKLALSRSFQSIGTLLSCNVPLVSALEHASKVAGNPVIAKALVQTREGIVHGGSLSESMEATKAFTPMLVQVVTVGERTGRLAPLISSHAGHLEEEVDARIKSLVSIVEPVMIAVMGGVVGFITISVISPIYSVVQNIK